MGNQLSSSQSPEEISRHLLNQQYFTQEGQPIEFNKLFTVVKLSPDSYNVLLGKVHVKSKELELSPYKSRFDSIQSKFSNLITPHLLISDYIENQKLVIIFRQYCETTLRKKLISPPFVNDIEKIWIAYQCLIAVQELHEAQFFHGDIKSENFLITSWNWVFLVDIGSYYKPNFLSEGDLTRYKYFFSTSERPGCYLPPEKFTKEAQDEKLLAQMDIFSLGCVIAEIFLDGQNLFTLPELLSYKRSILKVPGKLVDIKNKDVYDMVASMISVRPEDRKSIGHYLNFFKSCILPRQLREIYEYILQLAVDNSFVSAFARIQAVSEYYYGHELEQSEELLILAQIVTGNIRSVQTGSHMIESLILLTDIGKSLSDDSKLHRILPYMISILQNKAEKGKVKAACMSCIVQILEPVKKLSPRDSHLFNEYIWNAFSVLINDESDYVKTELARLLPSIAKIGRTFHDIFIHYSESMTNYNKDLVKFSEKFIRIFKDLIVLRPENQIQIELLSNFAELSIYLDQQQVINNIIPIVLSWLNKGDSYKVLILSQIPKLLEIISSPHFFTQIFTCIEDGLSQRNELVVYYTLLIFAIAGNIESHCLRKIIVTVVHPSSWIRQTVLRILKEKVEKMSPIDNFSILREILIDYIDLPKSAVELVTNECLENIHSSFTRAQLTRGAYSSNKLLKTIYETFKNRESKQTLPLVVQEKWKVYETNFQVFKNFSDVSEEPPRSFESLNLKGNLIGCFNEHESSVTNILVHDYSPIFASTSSDGIFKIWQLDSFATIKSHNIQTTSGKSAKIKSLGIVSDQFFVAHEEGIQFCDPYKGMINGIVGNKIVKAISLSENTLAIVEQQGSIDIYDTRTNLKHTINKISGYYGPVSCLCKGPISTTLAISTYSSALLIYDLRFANASMIFHHSSGLPILTMQSYNSNSLLVGCEDIALLDLKYGVCSVLLNASSSVGNNNSSINVSTGGITVPSFRETFDNEWIVKNCYSISHRTRRTYESPNIVRKIISPGAPFVISGGNDCLVRCWDLANPSKSCCIGQDPALKSRFREMEYLDVKFIVQDPVVSQNLGPVNKVIKRKDYQDMPNHRKCSHTDTILDLALATQPRTILLTASRDGTIKAWN